jgi:hypothetical protein
MYTIISQSCSVTKSENSYIWGSNIIVYTNINIVKNIKNISVVMRINDRMIFIIMEVKYNFFNKYTYIYVYYQKYKINVHDF